MGEEATKHLEEADVRLQEAIAENEKKKKAKKGKKDAEEEFDPKEFKYLPKELLQRMLAKRLQEDDCNAGAIFDAIASEYWPDEKFGIELICDAVPEQNVEVVVFTFNKEKLTDDEQNASQDDADQAETTEVCTNYRYARRHDPQHMPKQEDKKEELPEGNETSMSKKPKVAAKKKSNDKNNKKDPAQVEAEEKAVREAEEQ